MRERRWRDGGRAALAVAATAVAACVMLMLGAGTAAAHTELESTTPAAGETVATPVADVTLVFSGDVAVVTDGIVALDQAGQTLVPSAVAQPERSTVVASFTPALTGPVEIRWAVGSSDGHVIDGSFTFTATAPAPTTAAPTTAPPAPTTAIAPTATTTAGSPTTAPPASTAPATSTTSATSTTTTVTATTDGGGDDGDGGGWGTAALVAGAVGVVGAGAWAAVRYVPRR